MTDDDQNDCIVTAIVIVIFVMVMPKGWGAIKIEDFSSRSGAKSQLLTRDTIRQVRWRCHRRGFGDLFFR